MKVKSILLSLSLLISSISVHADQYHYENLLVGGPAIGLGGSFVAIADDLSAMHYNPAGLMGQQSTRSASVNTMSWESTEFISAFNDGSDFSRNSFTVVPGFMGINGNFDNWSIGSYFTILDFSRERATAETDSVLPPTAILPTTILKEYVNYDFDNSTYKLGFAAAYSYSPKLSIGTSIALKYSTVETHQEAGAILTFSGSEGDITSEFGAVRRSDLTEYILQPSLGVLWKGQALSFGAKLSKDFVVDSQFDSIERLSAPIVSIIANQPTTAYRFSTTSDIKQKLPLSVSLGSAYSSRGYVLSFQVNHYQSINDAVSYTDYGLPINRKLKQVTNFALGFKMPILNESALSIGFYTDKSNGIVDNQIRYQRVEAIDMLGVSIAFDSSLFGNPFTLGVNLKKGDGLARFSDIRQVNDLFKLPLYPESDNFDTVNAEKENIVIFASMDF